MRDNYPSDWETRRKKVYKQDNYRCQKCGARGGKRGDAELHAHHITPKSEGGSHRHSNLRTLCRSCHSDVHGHPVGGSNNSNIAVEAEVFPAAVATTVGIFMIVFFAPLIQGGIIQFTTAVIGISVGMYLVCGSFYLVLEEAAQQYT